MGAPTISFKSIGNLSVGERRLLFGLVDLDDPEGLGDVDALWFRDESSGGGYIEVNGARIASGTTKRATSQ